MNIRFAGFGGQGIVVAGYVLGQAAVFDGRNALQTQSYGSESRGGACKSDVTISDHVILDLAPSASDVLVAMSQPAYDKYLPNLANDGLLIYESDLVRTDANADVGPDAGRGSKPDNPASVADTCNSGPKAPARAYGLPATAVANKTYGRDLVANVIMIGYLAGLTGVASPESFHKAIAESVPAKTIAMNLKAFEDGFNRATEERDTGFGATCVE